MCGMGLCSEFCLDSTKDWLGVSGEEALNDCKVRFAAYCLLPMSLNVTSLFAVMPSPQSSAAWLLQRLQHSMTDMTSVLLCSTRPQAAVRFQPLLLSTSFYIFYILLPLSTFLHFPAGS